jgi:signal recognition particle subunit SRP54
MFPSLSDKLQAVFKNLRGYGKLTEKNIADALREVRMALLEADVNYKVAKDFIEAVKAKSLGQQVLDSITPGQQVVKIIYDELTALMGANQAGLDLSQSPAVFLLCGLHGCGKTTTAAKLARLLAKQGRKPLLVACDVYRPAAVTQLQTLGRQLGFPVHAEPGEKDVLKIARGALAAAEAQQCNLVIFDTAGRLQIDEPLVQELVRLRDEVKPQEILLVADSATGQQAVDIASHFDKALAVTGIILTKLDGDTRGGAALSMRQVTGKPIKLVGVGEKLEDLEPFYPDRMASRILGMGDVVSLVEKAQATVDAAQVEKMQEKLRKSELNLEDFLEQMQQIKKMGPLENLLGMLPGMSNIRGLSVEEKRIKRMEAIVLSMTPPERRRPEIVDGRRRQRIARGSGTTVAEVNQLLKQFAAMKQMMKQMPRLSRKMGRLAGMKLKAH